MRDRRYLIFIPLAALLAVLPLLVKGTSCGHDFSFHLHNWLEVSSQWKQGVVLPKWDLTAAWNSGEPRFVFYPPFSWTIGALLGLMIPWAAVPLAYIWLVLVACGFSMYRLASQWTSPGNALIVASFYMVHPYMLFVFYERAAYAEFLAAAFVPLLFLGILRARITIPGIAIPLALFWLTNVPAAVMACYTLALLAAMRIAFTYRSEQRLRPAMVEAAKIATGTLLGIALAGFFLVPAILQQRWIHIQMLLKGLRYQDNFIFTHIGDPSHDAILRTASLCALSLFVLSGIFTAVALYPRAETPGPQPDCDTTRRRTVLTLFSLACILGFLLSSLSAGLSRHIPELNVLRFPMRWCTMLGAVSAALFALALSRIDRIRFASTAVLALVLNLVFTLGGNFFFRQYCQNDGAIPGLIESFYKGSTYDAFDEYTPLGADPNALQHRNPAYWLADAPTDAAPPSASADYSIRLAHRFHFDVSAPAQKFLVLNLRDYPAWRIRVNGLPTAIRLHRDDGLIALPVGVGVSTVDLAYAHTRDEIAGYILSAFSALTLLLEFARAGRRGPA